MSPVSPVLQAGRDATGKVGYSSPEEPLEQAAAPGRRQEYILGCEVQGMRDVG